MPHLGSPAPLPIGELLAAPSSDKSFIFNHSHSTGVLRLLGLSPRASLQETFLELRFTEVQDAAPAPPSFLHTEVSGQRFREAPVRRESKNSWDPGPTPSKPFRHQPRTSSNRWQDAEGRMVAVTPVPTQQRYWGGHNPFPAFPTTRLSWGVQSLAKPKGAFSPRCHPQRAVSKQQQRAPKANAASSPPLPLGAPLEQAEPPHLRVHPRERDIPNSHGHGCHR